MLGNYFGRPIRPGYSREASYTGYGFLDGKNVSRAPEESIDGGPLNMVLAFGFEKDYLYAWLMLVEFELGSYPVMLNRLCKDCGERLQQVSHGLF